MTRQHCTTCGEHGHNARACPSTATVRTIRASKIPACDFAAILPTDPVVLALAAHGWDCTFCADSLERHREHPGEIMVFFDLCADGRKIIRDTPATPDQRRATLPGPGRDS